MKKAVFIFLLFFPFYFIAMAQAVYVDCNIGNDNNSGTFASPLYSIQKAVEIINSRDDNTFCIKINPGIYVLDRHITVSTEKATSDKQIIIEASTLPGDSLWSPEKMPVIINSSEKGEIPGYDKSYIVSFLVEESHVVIRGLKFHGHVRQDSRYFPVARLNMEVTDLLVEQCMFIGDKDASHIQVGVIGNGNEICVDHCVFYNVKNSVVFWLSSGDNIKYGNRVTNSIIYGACQSAIWTSLPDEGFLFENNIISGCKYVWVRNGGNNTKYTIKNCMIVNNRYYKARADEYGVLPSGYELQEINVVRDGDITLRMIENIDAPIPNDYLHVIPGTAGYNLTAGLFKSKND